MKISDEIITKLKELKRKTSNSSYPHIKNILKNQRIPVAFTEIKPYKLVRFRRHNNGENFFKNIEQLSYRKDILNIDNFGRANEPGQGFFYCTDKQETGMVEAVSIFRGKKDSNEEILTISAWDLKENLKLVMILPSIENGGKNSEFDEMKQFYNSFEKSKEYEDVVNFNEFLAKEFTLDLQKHNTNYKITCAFSNYIKEVFPQVDGIMYGSVKSEFNGINIVLWPEVVDKKIEFVAARKQVLMRTKEKTFQETQAIDNKGFDKQTGNIVWE